ncbi:MAG: hypothetical protein NPIRA04_34250 [Nitrospirales bacterium]|nr:MAG: hypothetical protein NPIRA04_34250 [Nitrospirales bacterium]
MFGFPIADRPQGGQFKRNLLKSVIFQVKFEQSEEVVAGFKAKRETLKNKLPITNPISQNFAEVRFEKDKTPIVQTANSPTHGYEFKTADNHKTLVVTEDTLSYTIAGPSYQNFSVAISEIKRDFFSILQECHVLKFNRVAIRKINLIEPIDLTLSNKDLLLVAFNEDLVHNITSLPDITRVASGVTNVTMENTDKRLKVAYGLLAPIQMKGKKQILLDIDLFFFNQNVPLNVIEVKWTEINDEIFNIFNWAISPELRADLLPD